MLIKDYFTTLQTEFRNYNLTKFRKDFLAGITVAAVAIPLSLAFGVSSGATAAAGLVTAILSGLIIGTLSGTSFLVSGLTGAMSAIIAPIITQYGLQGVFIASLMAGILILLTGVFNLGKIVSLIPSPVITGFTSGIAIIIVLGQINNLTGLSSKGENVVQKTASYFTTEQHFHITSFIIGIAVIILMFAYPKRLSKYCPPSLIALVLATLFNSILSLNANTLGEIPKTIMLVDHLKTSQITLSNVIDLIAPAISIAALGFIETLLCGTSAGRMKNAKMKSNVELTAQGIGMMIIPFFGGMPPTAAIARTSVGIKSDGQTRIVSIIHALILLISILVLSEAMSLIPLSALAGVLIATAWRMNEWTAIKSMFSNKIKTAIFQFLITMIATVIFDLTIAILIGLTFSFAMYIIKSSKLQIKTDQTDLPESTCIVHISGPLYFATALKLEEKIINLDNQNTVIFSMNEVTTADISGLETLKNICKQLVSSDKKIYLINLKPEVLSLINRTKFAKDFSYNIFKNSTQSHESIKL